MINEAYLYDAIQYLAGAREVHHRVQACLPSTVAAHAIVLDMGGGTASLRQSLPPTAVYVCLDIDPSKLQRAASRNEGARILLADATQTPLVNGCADIVVCTAVSHHLSEQQLQRMLDEIDRLLKDGGVLLFLDAIWMPERRLSRLLWRYDRGSYPRGSESLLNLLLERFSATRCERFHVYHEYLLFVGNKGGRGALQDAVSLTCPSNACK